jgi:adenine-specific DNA methylase
VDLRLIEAGFPCHQVGAETNRERDTGKQPPTARLHVWWARRPLTPSRAAILASLLPAGTDPDTFVRQLGIERVQALVHGEPWTLTAKLLERVEQRRGQDVLRVDAVVERAYLAEQKTRALNRDLVETLMAGSPYLAVDPSLRRWKDENGPLPEPLPADGEVLITRKSMGDPAWAKEKMAFTAANSIFFPGDAYGYARAFGNVLPYKASPLVVLDPTAGGGSIPFEALRLGHKVIANDLNPVATTILHATLDFPARFGLDLLPTIDAVGKRLLRETDAATSALYADGKRLPSTERQDLEKSLGPKNVALLDQFDLERIQDYLYVRQVTCPHCGGEAPLLNTCWLSKEAGDPWGVRVVPEDGRVRFETYRVKHGRGPNGEDPNAATVNRGAGQCVHCKQAIDGDEIKRQARASAKHPTAMADCPDGWRDRLYAVVAVRLEPKLDSHGQPLRYASGARKGEVKTTKVRYFRSPNQLDFDALAEAQHRLRERWDAWDNAGLIPTEEIPPGHRRDQRDGLLRYGITHWLDMFTARQLLGHLTLIETLIQLKPQILAELGPERGRAVVTYLQFAIDKGLDYNSRQTRWEFTRGVVKGTFGRHDFSLKWTFGEMIFSGPSSGAAWGLSQVLDAYKGMAELMTPAHDGTGGQPPVTILNGTGAHIPQVPDESVDLV